jgi:chemotaxis protein MotB
MRIALAVAFVGLTSACVSSGKFRQKQAEADQLRERAAQLETGLSTSQAELEAERKKAAELQAKVDDLSSSKSRLESAKADLEKKSVDLEKKSVDLEKKSVDLEKKSAEYEKMASALRRQIDDGRIELTELRGKMTVKMKDKILFSSGSARIGKEGQEALRAIAEVLAGVQDKVVRVEGHTDNVPLGRGGFATNWELSTARALAVVRLLQDAGVGPTRLAAAGYGEFQPIASNETPEGRSANRRIEIVLAPADAAAAPPSTPPSTEPSKT